ncbi:hypothetical protein GCM10017778_06700 [Streptomyces vinaceus]|nr:hypothetical protein GCM10017778_06700 [Streptomyces vinaceus]
MKGNGLSGEREWLNVAPKCALMNPQIGNAAAMFFDDFGPRSGASVILIRGHPFRRAAQAPRTAAPTPSDRRTDTI